MTHRERIQAALRHEVPDRQPVDLGATLATTMTIGAQERLRAHLGLPDTPPVIFSKRSRTVIPDEAILERCGADCRPVLLGAPELRPDRPVGGGAFTDEFGITWSRPAGGHYINTGGPFYALEEPGRDAIESFDWPDPKDPGRCRGLAERARGLREETDYTVIFTLGVGPVHQAQFMRGYARWLEDLILAPAFAQGLLERYTDFLVEVARQALAAAGQYIDIVMFGDDVGTQSSTLVRPEHYRQWIRPQHRRIVETAKAFGKPVFYHSCGSVAALVKDFIEIGVDILNPIQVSAAHMDTAALEREYGRDIVFWGAVDSQGVLPSGTPEDVREEVRRRKNDLAPGGGYVLATTHNIQADVPAENIVALYDEALSGAPAPV